MLLSANAHAYVKHWQLFGKTSEALNTMEVFDSNLQDKEMGSRVWRDDGNTKSN